MMTYSYLLELTNATDNEMPCFIANTDFTFQNTHIPKNTILCLDMPRRCINHPEQCSLVTFDADNTITCIGDRINSDYNTLCNLLTEKTLTYHKNISAIYNKWYHEYHTLNNTYIDFLEYDFDDEFYRIIYPGISAVFSSLIIALICLATNITIAMSLTYITCAAILSGLCGHGFVQLRRQKTHQLNNKIIDLTQTAHYNMLKYLV